MNVAALLRRRARDTPAPPGAAEPLRAWAPPVRRAEFWAVQGLVALIAGGHAVVELTGVLGERGPIYLFPVSLFFVPVVYAAVNFGLRGSLPTALWCALLTVPNLGLLHHGEERIGELWEIGVVVAVGIFVGHRVDRETRAREEAERRELARQASEERYRGLFDNAAEAILLLDPRGAVEEANAAAGELIGLPSASLRGRRIDELLGAELMAAFVERRSSQVVGPLMTPSRDGPLWIEPAWTPFEESTTGTPRVQAILRDVTLQQERQQGLESYARRTVATREEERRRIARDLHDGPLQSIILLWRKLDSLDRPATPEARETVAEARALAERIADELRRFSRDMRPSVLDDLGLTAALKSEATALEQRSGISVRFLASGSARRLPPDLELSLLRITQEALRNVERHAAATRVLIRLSFRDSRVRLTISDDGRGFGRLPPASELLANGKLGLVGMQERARLAGASLSIEGGPRGGTTVEVVAGA